MDLEGRLADPNGIANSTMNKAKIIIDFFVAIEFLFFF